ncbi:hypothetical protein BDA99DRAFT_429140 [Phascolomyces articulosus]|uniref:Enoyl reductase (ER) domain-containing protein n=1 Tax=Phascolomyces articulosus TaxID=60185 RepID=A0AAD5JZ41_9FUNG|nr:hypothetical protein BDA99DRAFT_448902 [Phascolomyces articulosus]KAI9278686.1 hypothetical protein BDA99DRAFT_429140 [Phascolomyces articulosus]
MSSTSNKEVRFSKIPTTYPFPGEHLTVSETNIDLDAPLKEGEFLLKLLVLSVDPYMRARMRDPSIKSYFPPFSVGKPMNGGTVSVVVKSNNDKFKEGDIVTGFSNFQEYTLGTKETAPAFEVRKEPKENGIPLTNFVGILGMPGLTAYAGLLRYGKPKEGETLYISAASGAVGQIVGQLGKVLGLYVVGSAGSDDKVEYLKEIGFDDAFNYKTAGDLTTKLAEVCPKGIDIYFENVGGKMLEAVINNCNAFGRIVACGMISQYNLEKPEGIHNIMQVVTKRLRIEGFIVSDSADMEQDFRRDMIKWISEGKIKYRETVVDGIEATPQAMIDMLQGKNFGKQVIKVADL